MLLFIHTVLIYISIKMKPIYLSLRDRNAMLENNPGDTLVAGRGGEGAQVSPVAKIVCEQKISVKRKLKVIKALIRTWQELGRVNIVIDLGELSFELDAFQAGNNLFDLIVGVVSKLE